MDYSGLWLAAALLLAAWVAYMQYRVRHEESRLRRDGVWTRGEVRAVYEDPESGEIFVDYHYTVESRSIRRMGLLRTGALPPEPGEALPVIYLPHQPSVSRLLLEAGFRYTGSKPRPSGEPG